MNSFKVKYYKGLGTSTDKEAKEYFQEIDTHTIDFLYEDQEDDNSIDLFFNKKKADMRKQWLANFVPTDFIDHTQSHMTYQDFINKEMIHYAMDSNIRAIPHVMDGLKPSQRKILFACFKRNLKEEVKVAQL